MGKANIDRVDIVVFSVGLVGLGLLFVPWFSFRAGFIAVGVPALSAAILGVRCIRKAVRPRTALPRWGRTLFFIIGLIFVALSLPYLFLAGFALLGGALL